MEQQYESKIIDDHIAYWKFKIDATPTTFAEAFDEFNTMVRSPKISKLMVNVEMKNAWGRDIQEIWLKAGEIADTSGITKWTVVSQEKSKQLTIRHLVKGGGAKRQYSYYITDNESSGFDWLNGTD